MPCICCKSKITNLAVILDLQDGGLSRRTGSNSLSTREENAEFANIVDLDEVAHNEPPHLDVHCLPSSL